MKIKSQVIRLRHPHAPVGARGSYPWATRAVTVLEGENVESFRCTRTEYRASWPEAMQAGQVLRAELEHTLMDEVHASRASRRTERTAQLEAEEPALPVPVKANHVAFCTCSECTRIRHNYDLHGLEATA